MRNVVGGSRSSIIPPSPFASHRASVSGIDMAAQRCRAHFQTRTGRLLLLIVVQDRPFYTAFHVACLRPQHEMSVENLLYACTSIRANRYRYSYGRQANRTLKELLLSALEKPARLGQ